MSDDGIHPWVGILLGALLAGANTAVVGLVIDGPEAIAAGLGLAMPILLLYGAGETFDREQYLADHSTSETVADMVVIAIGAVLAGVLGVIAVAAVTGSQIAVYGVAAGATFLGGYVALYVRQPEYHGTVRT